MTLTSSQRSFHPRIAFTMARRGLLRAPGTSALAVIILALGLAAPVTFFSILVGAIRPLPVPGGERIVRVDVLQPARGGRSQPIRLADLDLLEAGAGMEGLGAFRTFGGTLVDPGRPAVRVSGAALTPRVLPLLQVEPVLGRVPDVDEAATTLLLGHDVWEEAYGADPGALGRTVELGGAFRTVVGVLPDGFGFPFRQNAWVILPRSSGDTLAVELVGRLAEGADASGAEVELAGRWARGDVDRADGEVGGVLEVKPYTGSRGESGEAVAFLGLVLVALALLLIACSNVANLLLARATERVRTLAVQSALGAGRGQIAAQLLLESLLLSAAGGVAGVYLANLAVGAVERGLAAEHFGYFWMRMAVDGRVLGFAGVLVLGSALVAGTLPVLRVWKVEVHRVLKEEGAASGMGGGGWWSRALVTAQLALSCAALVAAGLSARSLDLSGRIGGDLATDGILVATLDLASVADDPARVLERLDERIAAIPGVVTEAFGLGAPAYGEPYARYELEGIAQERPEDRDGVLYNAVTPPYFEMMGVGLLAGRALASSDAEDAEPVAVVSESFVRRHQGTAALLGRRIRVVEGDASPWHTIVGVVEDLDVGGGARTPRERVYFPLAQTPSRSVLLMASTVGDGAVLATPVREAVAAVDPHIAFWQVRTLAGAHAYMIRVPRAMGAMALGGGAAGLLVAAVGLYGLVAFRVRRRRRDLGVQLALGADGRRLALHTFGFALGQVVPALLVGLTLAWLAAPALGVFLMGIDPRGMDTYVAVAASFVLVGLLAAAPPALRASRIDPAQALRGE